MRKVFVFLFSLQSNMGKYFRLCGYAVSLNAPSWVVFLSLVSRAGLINVRNFMGKGMRCCDRQESERCFFLSFYGLPGEIMTDPRSLSDSDLMSQAGSGARGSAVGDLKRQFASGGCDYYSHRDLETAVVPKEKAYISIATPVGKLMLQRDARGTAAMSRMGAKWAPFGEPYPHHFGALSDNRHDDTRALNAWLVYLRQNELMGRLPAGNYRTTDTLDLSGGALQTRWGFAGDGKRVTRIRPDFSDASRSVMALLQNKASVQFSGFSIQPHDNQPDDAISPVGMHFGRLGNSFLTDVGFYRLNNSILRTARLANVRVQDLESWSCGVDFKYKDTSGILFTLSGTTLTADADIFDPEDVGKHFVLNSAGYLGRRGVFKAQQRQRVLAKYAIAGFGDARRVRVSADFLQDAKDVSGYFAAPRIASGRGKTLVADRACFSPAHVGLRIWVANPSSADKVDIVTIRSVRDPYRIEIDHAIAGEIVDQEFAVCVVDISDPDMRVGGNDYLFRNAHIEHYAGVAVGVHRHTLGRFSECKLHGEVYSNEGVSIAHMWHSVSGGQWESSGFLDRSPVGEAQLRFFDQRGQDWYFDRLISTYILNQTVFKLGTFTTAGGLLGHVTAGSAYFRSNYKKENLLADLVQDANDPSRLDFMGTITTQQGEEDPAATLPETVQFGLGGDLFSYQEGAFVPSFSDESGHTVAISDKAIQWRKVGDQVTVYFNFTNDINLSSLVAADTLRINLPFPVAVHAFAQALFTDGPVGAFIMWAWMGKNYAVFKDPSDASTMSVSDFSSGTVDLVGCTLTYTTNN